MERLRQRADFLAAATGAKVPAINKTAIEKGQKEELEAFGQGLRSGKWPIPLWEQIQATEIALQVESQIGLPAPA